MIDATSQGTGLIESLIGTFGTSSHLFPRPNRTEAAPLGRRNNCMKPTDRNCFFHTDLLRELDRFLPRVILGKESFSDGRPAPTGGPDLSGFNHLKRDLVRLLGILCYEERAVQDRIRMREGITVVMNLCVTDERNPCKDALSSLRYPA